MYSVRIASKTIFQTSQHVKNHQFIFSIETHHAQKITVNVLLLGQTG